jgi:preprotein translocase subunit SecE
VSNITTYIKESYDELVHKVTWPTWKELQNSALLVLVASLIFAFVIFFIDFIFGIRPTSAGDGFQWKGILGFVYDILNDL